MKMNESIDVEEKAHLTLSERTVLHIVEVDGKRLAITESCSQHGDGQYCDHVSCSIVQIKD